MSKVLEARVSTSSKIALVIIKEHYPEKQFEYVKKMQYDFFYQGISPEDFGNYAKIAAGFGLNKETFKANMQDSYFLEKAEQEFDWVRRLELRGFPTIMIKQGNSWVNLSHGYVSLSTLGKRFLRYKTQLGNEN